MFDFLRREWFGSVFNIDSVCCVLEYLHLTLFGPNVFSREFDI